jgi:thiol-disulfide isomerase/thioredoxin
MILVAGCSGENAAATDPGTAVDPAPDFTVRLAGGGSFTLSEHLDTDGRPVFLNFWASWCIPCRNEMPDIDAAAAEHPGVFALGIATLDDPEAATEFADEIGVAYAIGFDESAIKDELYPSVGLPATFLIDGDGNIVGRRLGEVDAAWIEDAMTSLAN